MKKIKVLTIICLSVIILQAQDITNKLGGTSAGDTYDVTDSSNELLLRIQADGGFLFYGKDDLGTIPIEGAGVRMMFYDGKGAFRAGWVNGTQWDNTNVGVTSFASGQHTTASGNSSTAMGSSTTASGNTSTAMGYNTTASGNTSTAMGYKTTANGPYSIATG